MQTCFRHNSSILEQIGVRDYDVDVRCLTGSRNMAVSRMRNEKYAIWPLVIAKIAAQFSDRLVNSAMGQIPCSTERISCLQIIHVSHIAFITPVYTNVNALSSLS